ncbi:hypothetical protein [Lysobacter gummosus]|uniref:hypothetical protein n=1 Tax=Lysobacter gummosus TaxID=262324 RepID=UPI003626512F
MPKTPGARGRIGTVSAHRRPRGLSIALARRHLPRQRPSRRLAQNCSAPARHANEACGGGRDRSRLGPSTAHGRRTWPTRRNPPLHRASPPAGCAR